MQSTKSCELSIKVFNIRSEYTDLLSITSEIVYKYLKQLFLRNYYFKMFK